MLNKCDIIILTANFGTGHIAVAKEIKAQLLKQAPNLKVEIIDVYKMLHPRGYKVIYRGYELLVKNLPYLYNQYYYGKENFEFLKKVDTLSKFGIQRLRRFISEKTPKAIVSTFPSCTGYMAQYKKHYNNKIPLFTCITDVVCNNEWIYPENDFYFVADYPMQQGLINKGVNADKIKVTGIPIRKRFLKQQDEAYYKKQLGYEKEDKIVLLMGGGLGLLPKDIEFYLWLLNQENVQVVALTSKNSKLLNQLNGIGAPNLRVFSFCEQVSEYMTIANILIGKSGGITLFESIASYVPLIVYKPKLGQEVENSRYIIQKGIGYVVNNEKELKQTVLLALQPRIQEQLKVNLVEAKKSINPGLIKKTILEVINNKTS